MDSREVCSEFKVSVGFLNLPLVHLKGEVINLYWDNQENVQSELCLEKDRESCFIWSPDQYTSLPNLAYKTYFSQDKWSVFASGTKNVWFKSSHHLCPTLCKLESLIWISCYKFHSPRTSSLTQCASLWSAISLHSHLPAYKQQLLCLQHTMLPKSRFGCSRSFWASLLGCSINISNATCSQLNIVLFFQQKRSRKQR